jgi:hypothetical protein
VSLPESAASADLLNMLPPHLAAKYASPEALLLPDSELPNKPPPRPVMKIDQQEYRKLFLRMHAKGMLTVTREPKVVNGLFAVPKDVDKQRFIIDARPANFRFRKSPDVQLPTPDLLATVRPVPGKPLYVGKIDLDNFYHRIRLPDWMCPYFALPPLRAGDVGLEAEYGADTTIWPCCATLPMGFSHSVFLA